MNEAPLVTIGIPAYNREKLIVRAIESALGQDYPHLEVIVSDNASTDGTQAVCQEFAARDSRLIYLRHETNRGAAVNFETVLERATGKYFMWLGDDDWFDSNYISRCLQILEDNPDHAAAYGRALYYRDGAVIWDRSGFSLLQESGADRVIAYYRLVDDNAVFYGMFRREVLQVVGSLPNVAGGDWLLISAVAFMGKIGLVSDACVHRELGGTSDNYQKIVAALGLPAFFARIFMLRVGWEVWKDVLRSPAYAPLGRWARMRLALRCQPWLIKRFLWSIYYPLKGRSGDWIFSLSQKPLTRPLYQALRGSVRVLRRK